MILTPTPKKVIQKRFNGRDYTRGSFEEGKSIDFREVRTNLRRIKRPPKERKRLFQPVSLILMRDRTDSQNNKRF